jgi:hypothetical protein
LSSSIDWVGFEGTVEHDQKLSHRGGEGKFRWFASSAQSLKVSPSGAVGFIDHRRSNENKISTELAAFLPVSFHSHIEVCDFLRELLLNRSFLDLAGAQIQRFFQALNLFQEFHLFRNNVCALQD